VHWQNISFDDRAHSYDINSYATGGQELVWFDGVRFTSTGPVNPTTLRIPSGAIAGNKKAAYLTDCVRDRGYNGFQDVALARGCTVSGIQEDAYTNSEMIVNSTAHDIQIAPGVHSDIYQCWGGKANVVVYGLRAWNVPDTQGLFLGGEYVPSGEYAMNGGAFVNISLDHTGNNAAQSQVKGRYHHIIYDNVQWTAQSLNFRVDLDLECTYFVVGNCALDQTTYNKYVLCIGFGAGVPPGVTFTNCTLAGQ
jgi:hypothetical protein